MSIKQRVRGLQGVAVVVGPIALTLATTLLCLALAGTALAGPPTHSRKPALDIAGLNRACGAAVDSEGDVYAAGAGESKVKVFDSSHKELTSISNAGEPCGLAVDSKGILYVSEKATGEVVRYKPNAYPFSGTPTYGSREVIDGSGSAKGISVDPFDDRLYVAEGNHIALYKSNGSFEADVGEADLTEAAGVASYTYEVGSGQPVGEGLTRYLSVADAATDQVKIFSGPSVKALKFRRTIKGPKAGEDFGFGPAGSPVAVDRANGHFLVYDDAHSAVDEFDATGEFLDKLTNAAFDDAEPTALAVDRSGKASDGTVYVGAGPGVGAKLVAFGPLMLSTPARPLLEGLSHAIKSARAVATDSFGDVYVAAEAKIFVYDSAGNKLLEFEDTRKAYSLAVDGEGNLYVLDGTNPKKEQLTYYVPAAYPPKAATKYTRHEPFILEGQLIEKVAVNPANDRVFVGRGFTEGSGSKKIQEFGSAKEGSKEIPFAPFYEAFNGVKGLGVYGANGSVYAGNTNGQPIDVIDSAGTEFLARINDKLTGISGPECPAGAMGENEPIGVEQSNGHLLEFSPGQAGNSAREYDAAGSCVAEFGAFSEGGGAIYAIAADNACAIHRNGKGETEPLDETTTPTCKAFDPANGNVYVAFDGNDNKVQPYDLTAFGPLSYVGGGEPPDAVTGIADDFGPPGSATLHGTVKPNSLLEECKFEYLTDDVYQENIEEEDPAFEGATSEECAESLAGIGEGSKPVPVHTDLEGLEPDTAYRFRLVARNANGESPPDGVGFFGPPAITAKKALPVLYGEATLRAEIDPSGLATEYHFDYGQDEGYGQSTPPAKLPAGEGPVAVQAPLTGLEEGTEYHFQLVATNPIGTVKGPKEPDQTFETLERRVSRPCPNTEYRTGPSANLPDCRAYELVTPADAHGGVFNAVSGANFNNWLADPRGQGAGESVAYFSGALPGFPGSGDTDGYRAQRDDGAHPAGGWTNEFASPTYEQLGGAGGNPQKGVASDQRYSLWQRSGFGEVFENTLAVGEYLRTPAGAANEECNVPETENPQGEFELVGCGSLGVDPDANGNFVSAEGAHVIFSSKEHLEGKAAPKATESIYDRVAGTSSAEVVSVEPDGSAFGESEGAKYVAAGEDGSAVLFEVGDTLYLYRAGETTEIAKGKNTYASISEDGKRVFYMDSTFVDDPPPAGLFACDVESGPCAGSGAHAPTEIAQESIFVNVSPDGSHVFFTSKEALTDAGEENEHHEHAETGEHNLYAWDGSSTRFLGILDPQDFVDGFEEIPGFTSQENMFGWVEAIRLGRGNSPTRSTPDGRVFVFLSHSQLTSYDNEGKTEIYRYDPAAPLGRQLVCVSCDPSGAPASGEALFQVFGGVGHTQRTTLIPNVTDDGNAVFFVSPARLLPEDVNSAVDVYEWMAKGAGEGPEECKRSQGCLALISSGQGEGSSYLYGMSADGHDVFFETLEKLVEQDIPGSNSIYDARVEGGIPESHADVPCHGDACQGEGSAPPVLASPTSTAPVPDGNEPSAPGSKCPKGKHRVKGKGRCVGKHRRARHGPAKHRANHSRRAGR